MHQPSDVLLDLHCKLNLHLDRLGRGPSVERLRATARDVRRLAARAALVDFDAAVALDPVAAVARAAELALQAGADWQEICAAVSRVGMRRDH